MKFLGVGLSKTGTVSLHRALQLLGFQSLHYTPLRFKDIILGSSENPSFRKFDDVDAVTDIPAAYFYHELLGAYPQAKAILTIRDTEEWWKSAVKHFNIRTPVQEICNDSGGNTVKIKFPLKYYSRCMIYGAPVASEFLYKKKFEEHNQRVRAEIPNDRLLVMNICEGDGWEKLCPFLGVEAPDIPFPHANKRTDHPS